MSAISANVLVSGFHGEFMLFGRRGGRPEYDPFLFHVGGDLTAIAMTTPLSPARIRSMITILRKS